MAYIANYYVHGEITSQTDLPQWLIDTTGLSGGTPEASGITIWINSNGGDVVTALEAINLIKSSPIPVTTIVNGAAESAALLILMSGHKRIAVENSWGMAHHFSTEVSGSYHDIQDSVAHNKLLHGTLKDIWLQHSKTDLKTINKFMLGRGSTWLSATELLTYGVVDKVLKPGPELFKYIWGEVTIGMHTAKEI